MCLFYTSPTFKNKKNKNICTKFLHASFCHTTHGSAPYLSLVRTLLYRIASTLWHLPYLQAMASRKKLEVESLKVQQTVVGVCFVKEQVFLKGVT